MNWTLRYALMFFGGALLAPVAGLVAAGPADVALTPLSCAPGREAPRSYEAPPDALVYVCPDRAGRPEILIITGPDVSWPVLRGVGGGRSLEGDLLNAVQSFGAGLLYFDSDQDTVWVASINELFIGHIVSMSGNDPVTLERKRAFVSVPAQPGSAVMLHSSLGEALDNLLAS